MNTEQPAYTKVAFTCDTPFALWDPSLNKTISGAELPWIAAIRIRAGTAGKLLRDYEPGDSYAYVGVTMGLFGFYVAVFPEMLLVIKD